MSELCLSRPSRTHLSSLLLSNFFLFCSFIASHPLYFTYLIFFSPYLLKLLSFLSPLFITTSLLLLALLTASPCLIVSGSFSKESSDSHAESKGSFLTAAYHAVVERLRSKIDDHNEEELLCLEDFEVFKIVFGNPTTQDDKESQVEGFDAEVLVEDTSLKASNAPVIAACVGHQDFGVTSNEALMASKLESESEAFVESESTCDAMECFLQEVDESENVKVNATVEKKKIEPPCTVANKAVDNHGEKSPMRNGSEAAGNKIRHATTNTTNSAEVGKGNGIMESKSKLLKAHSHSVGASADYTNDKCIWKIQKSSPSLDYNLGGYGSMRKGKDWKRTLACKLFEERNNADEGEGMDLLWETYEVESTKSKAKSKSKKKSHKKKNESKHRECEDMSCDGHDEEEEESEGQFCCLQALKLSAGRVNLGMARPNLVKISKAIKGIGWLHNLSRHSKKVHSGDRF
ncbi:uncharacterized protein LOC113781944 [Coffea eugenioides]|uniref:uncharacterized protein LOC113781944 n=1 Tax=Coffea eugenioides TaxID=49369 RepID=UPI000F61443D|nr:uncharacterized protein LOC113781944 [Coffea eugenioides]